MSNKTVNILYLILKNESTHVEEFSGSRTGKNSYLYLAYLEAQTQFL